MYLHLKIHNKPWRYCYGGVITNFFHTHSLTKFLKLFKFAIMKNLMYDSVMTQKHQNFFSNNFFSQFFKKFNILKMKQSFKIGALIVLLALIGVTALVGQTISRNGYTFDAQTLSWKKELTKSEKLQTLIDKYENTLSEGDNLCTEYAFQVRSSVHLQLILTDSVIIYSSNGDKMYVVSKDELQKNPGYVKVCLPRGEYKAIVSKVGYHDLSFKIENDIDPTWKPQVSIMFPLIKPASHIPSSAIKQIWSSVEEGQELATDHIIDEYGNPLEGVHVYAKAHPEYQAYTDSNGDYAFMFDPKKVNARYIPGWEAHKDNYDYDPQYVLVYEKNGYKKYESPRGFLTGDEMRASRPSRRICS